MKVRVTSECECVVILLWQVIKAEEQEELQERAEDKAQEGKAQEGLELGV